MGYIPPAPSVRSSGPPIIIDNTSGSPGDVLTKIDDNYADFQPGGGGGRTAVLAFAYYDGSVYDGLQVLGDDASNPAFGDTIDPTYGVPLDSFGQWIYVAYAYSGSSYINVQWNNAFDSSVTFLSGIPMVIGFQYGDINHVAMETPSGGENIYILAYPVA